MFLNHQSSNLRFTNKLSLVRSILLICLILTSIVPPPPKDPVTGMGLIKLETVTVPEIGCVTGKFETEMVPDTG